MRVPELIEEAFQLDDKSIQKLINQFTAIQEKYGDKYQDIVLEHQFDSYDASGYYNVIGYRKETQDEKENRLTTQDAQHRKAIQLMRNEQARLELAIQQLEKAKQCQQN